MSHRLLAALTALGLLAVTHAGDKKKIDYAPATGPQPRQLHDSAGKNPSGPNCLDAFLSWLNSPPVAGGATLPSPHYLEAHPPKYLAQEPTATGDQPGNQAQAYVIAEALKAAGVARGAKLDVVTHDGVVELSGLVVSEEQHEQVLSVVKKVGSVRRIETTVTVAAGPFSRVYHVGDLVIPIPPSGTKVVPGATTHEAELIKKIMANVEPTHWATGGGKGTIDYFPIGMALVVNATPKVHVAIERYLDDLRQIQDTQFTIKLVAATVTDAGLEKMGLARDFGMHAGQVRSRVRFLSADELPAFAGLKGHCVSLSAPTITVLNGQEGSMTCGQVEHFLTGVDIRAVEGQLVFTPKNEPHQLGLEVKVRPTLSADRKFVKLAVNAQAREVTRRPVGQIPISTKIKPVFENGAQGAEVPFTQFLQDPRIVTRSVDETVTLPDGGTVVFYGGPAAIEETVRELPPMFADVPLLQELFGRDKKVSSTNHLLVFATVNVVKDAGCDECVQCAGGSGKLVKLMAEYSRACREGNVEEARRLALECVVIDPTCFGTK